MVNLASHPPDGKSGPKKERAAWSSLIDADQVVEVRAFGVDDQIDSRLFTGPTGAAQFARNLDGTRDGIYFTLNPIKPGTKRSASDRDILRRRWLLIDCDPTRPADTSATDAEKAASYETAIRVRDYLRSLGWPEPVLCDSGNGYHLLYRIDLPNDDESRELVKRLLHTLADRFDGDACKIDRVVYNASRICKLYGTLVCKGENTQERPHRRSRIIEMPNEPGVVSRELLEVIARESLPKPGAKPKKAGQGTPRDVGGRDDRYVLAALEKELAKLAAKPEGSQDRNNQLNRSAFALGQLVGGGLLDEGTVIRELTRVAEQIGLGDGEATRTIRSGLDAGKAEPRGKPERSRSRVSKPSDDDSGHPEGVIERVEIEITTRRHEAVEQTLDALRRAPNLYSRGEQLVTVSEETTDRISLTKGVALEHAAGSPKIITLAESVIGSDFITRYASFYQYRKDRSGEEYPADVHPPDWLVKTIANLKHWPGIRTLDAIVECPFPRSDGTIVEVPGYDAQTRTLYRPSGAFPAIPDRPAQDDAREAWGRIKEPFSEFPFVDDDDRAVLLAGLLTPIARPAIDDPVPGIAVIGNKAATGKGLLIDCCGIPATGRKRLPTSSYPADPVEANKVKLAIALSGKPIVHFDNLANGGIYGNSGIDSAITSDTVDDRILCQSRFSGEIRLRVSWFLNGNNITPAEDAYRRWLVMRLKTEEERPEERRCAIEDLRGYILERRGEFIRDLLTILKAHALAGRPRGDWAPMGSFGRWDRIIRGAVWYATGLDCCRTLRKTADSSGERQNRIALLEGWRELPGGASSGVTTAKAIKLVEGNPADFETLRNALMAFGREGKLVNSRSLGRILAGLDGNVIGGMKFVTNEKEHGATRWKVVENRDADPPSSDGGDDPGEFGESSEFPNQPSRGRVHAADNVHTSEWNGKAAQGRWKANSPNSPNSPPGGVEGGIL